MVQKGVCVVAAVLFVSSRPEEVLTFFLSALPPHPPPACSPTVLSTPHRAFYSLRKCGIEADDVRMAVCVMRVVPARYAFVIHTKNPSNNDANEVGEGRG